MLKNILRKCVGSMTHLLTGQILAADHVIFFTRTFTSVKHHSESTVMGDDEIMKKTKLFRRLSAVTALIILTVLTAGCSESFIVLDPKGPIGAQQRDLMLISTLLCLIIIVPVLIITAVIVWRYRDKKGNKAAYHPKWEHSTKLETIWWSIPIVIIIILGAITIRYTHELEPSKPLESDVKPITVQVTSLDWKWLFNYPEQGIATVNYVQFPEDVPIKFELTSDAPMNSFWIPQLGGQIYTMSGMAMTLHLQADEQGEYMGSGANFSGRDFASMKFTAKATTQEAFDKWVAGVKEKSPALTMDGYKQLAKPGVADVQSFSSFPEGLFQQIVTKYSAFHNHGLSHGAPTKSTEPDNQQPNDVNNSSKDAISGQKPGDGMDNMNGMDGMNHSDNTQHSEHK
jgi:cytochrome o ubiquinol oxidase subunit 2